MKRFAILLAVSPYQGTLPLRAIATIKTALSKGHAVYCFLYEDGVLFANQHRNIPQGETDPARMIQRLANRKHCEIVACVTAAERRGISESNVLTGIRLSGLGEWTEQLQAADRVVQFR